MWQPIYTVPRDETDVLLCWTYTNGVGPDIRIGRFWHESWQDKKPMFKLELDWGSSCACVYTGSDDVPTHWMPIPPPPVAMGGKEE